MSPFHKKKRSSQDVEQGTKSQSPRHSSDSNQKASPSGDEYEQLLNYVDIESGRSSQSEEEEEEEVQRKRIWYDYLTAFYRHLSLTINQGTNHGNSELFLNRRPLCPKNVRSQTFKPTLSLKFFLFVGLRTNMSRGLNESDVNERRSRVGYNELER